MKILSLLLKAFFNKTFFVTFILACAPFFCLTIRPKLPQTSSSNLILCNQIQSDIKRSLIRALNEAQKSIFISCYSITDLQIIESINQKAVADVPIWIVTDQKHLTSLRKKLHPNIHLMKFKQRGLMHHKIFVVDQYCFFGSTNLTTQSLRMHDNIMFVKKNDQLAQFFKNYILDAEHAENELKLQNFCAYLLPSNKAFERLVDQIKAAKHEIKIAMFTFTHPLILQALIDAKSRGVKVSILIDYLSQKGASRKLREKLIEHGFKVFTNRGMQLMHHKMALIDNHFVMGSVNWTQSGFAKNQELIVFFDQLPAKDAAKIRKMWRHLFWEAKELQGNSFHKEACSNRLANSFITPSFGKLRSTQI